METHMTIKSTVDSSKLLGFDVNGDPIFDLVAQSSGDHAQDHAVGSSKAEGGSKAVGGGKALGITKADGTTKT